MRLSPRVRRVAVELFLLTALLLGLSDVVHAAQAIAREHASASVGIPVSVGVSETLTVLPSP